MSRLLKFPENPASWQVTEALERVRLATEHYEMEESANPVERFDDWLKHHRIPERLQPAEIRAWWICLTAGGLFLIWLTLRS